MEQITCKDLNLGYDGHVVARDISFSVNKGDYLCIVGENGSGKSTLMKTILGLLSPVSGKILTGENLKQTMIGYLPQQNEFQKDFPASVEEIVLSGFQARMGLRPFYTKEEKKEARENMEQLKIADLMKKSYKELSGGQRQRVLLCRALCATKDCLLLDEPVSGLDPGATVLMYKLIEELHKEGITIIMISHDVEAAVKYASHILHISKNSFYGTKEEYLKSSLGKYYVESTKGVE